MKLSIKIFLGIIIPSMIVIVVISGLLINRSFNNNLEFQTRLYTGEIDNLKVNISNSIEKYNGYTYNDVLSITGKYYQKNDKYLLLYTNNKLEYSNNESFNDLGKIIENIDDDSYNSLIEKRGSKYYNALALKLDDNNILVYIRDITDVYIQRDNMIRLCVILVSIMFIIVIFVAYIISKTLTRPLFKMKREMSKLSKGNFDISLKEGKDEIGQLSKDFNIMSKELQKRNNELVDMIDSKQLFIDNLSHEMNTPLTSIYGYSKLLENAELNEEQKIKYLQYIQSETNRISDMYKKLLAISYKSNKELDIQYNKMDIILDELKNELKTKLEEKSINLIIDNNINEIKCDKILASLAISNLIRNAIEISDENKEVKIHIYEDNNNKYIEVIDQGKGIEEEQISKIIEPFYRVDKARSRAHGGAGLGLSIVTKVMELHNGKLDIKSKIGQGSTFILIFPK